MFPVGACFGFHPFRIYTVCKRFLHLDRVSSVAGKLSIDAGIRFVLANPLTRSSSVACFAFRFTPTVNLELRSLAPRDSEMELDRGIFLIFRVGCIRVSLD